MNLTGQSRRLMRIIVIGFAVIAVLCGSLLITAYVLTPRLVKYQPQITQQLSTTLATPVTIDSMQAEWRWLSPVIFLHKVHIWNATQDKQLLTIEDLHVRISIWDLLFKQKVTTTRIAIDNLKTSLTQTAEGGFQLDGFPMENTASDSLLDLLTDVVAHDRIKISDITLDLQLLDGEHLILKNINGSLRQRWGNVLLHLDGTLLDPQQQPPVRGIISLKAKLDPAHLLPKEWQGEVSIDLEQLDFPTWAKLFPSSHIAIQSGSGRLAIRSDWQAGIPQLLQTSVAIEDLTFNLPALEPYLHTIPEWVDTNLSGDMEWQKLEEGWQFIGKNVSLTRDNIYVPSTSLRLIQKIPAGKKLTTWEERLAEGEYSLEFDRVDLAIVEDVIASSPLLEKKLPQWWPVGLTGKVENVVAKMDDITTEKPIINLSGTFENLGLPYQKAFNLGFQGLSGSVNIQPTEGQLIIDSEQLQLQMQNVFTVGIELPKLSTKVTWKAVPEGWLINGNGRTELFEQGLVNASGQFLLKPNKEDSEIELHVEANNIPIVQASAMYMPRLLLRESLVKWLDLTLQAGTLEQTNLELQGKLGDFPFTDKPGKFEMTVHGVDASLNFHEDWPPLTELDGQLIFRKNEFYANIIQAKIADEIIDKAVVTIPAISNDGFDLQVIGKTSGDAENIEAFVKETPLWSMLKDRFEFIDASGPVDMDLSFTLPIAKPEEKLQISGAIDFHQSTVNLSAWNLAFEQVDGILHFSETGIYSDNLTGNLFNKPVKVSLGTQTAANGNNYLAMQMQGSINMQNIQQRYPDALWQDWQGFAPFTANLEWRQSNDPTPSTFQFKSNLAGLAIPLPAPFGKTAEQTKNITVNTTFGGKEQHTKLQYDGSVIADIYTASQQNKLAFARGTVNILNKTVIAMPKNGLEVIATMNNLDIDSWIAVGKKMLTASSATPTKYPVVNVKINTEKVKVFDKNWEIRQLNLQHNAAHWTVGVTGTDIKGQAIVPDNLQQSPIDLHLTYLSWHSSETETAKTDIPFPPANFPNFQVKIDQLLLNNGTLGTLTLTTKKEPTALAINSIKLTNPNYTVSAAARWESGKMQTLSYLQGTMNSKDLGQMLKNLQLSEGMEKGKGKTTMDLQWVGSPMAWDLNNLKGKMNIDWTNGHLAQIKPGLGRVLSLFNVDSLTRRLRLDFSDVVKKGFTFDKITADMNFNQGVISTSNGIVTSTSGEIDFNGKAFTTNKTLDMNLTVKPSLTGPLPIAATVASGGNPLVGALAAAVDKAITPKITGGLVGMHYKVTGDWQDPQIKKLN